MRTVSYRFSLFLAMCSFAILAGCATGKQTIPQPEEFASTDVHSHSFPGSAPATCEAARRALLSQGYVISEGKNALVKGNKSFQPDSDIHVQIQFNVVCAPDSKGSNSTTAFVNAVRDRYSLKKSSNSASLGVGVLGSVSLPIGYTDDALVKVASETIQTKKFYQQFFELVERYLDDSSVEPEGETRRTETQVVKPSGTEAAER